MTLSSDELEILNYLKSWKGSFVTMVEICRCAGGRRKFKESPHWAKALMARLVDTQMVEVNERGHYRVVGDPDTISQTFETEILQAPKPAQTAAIVGDDYFPASPPNDDPSATDQWLSPHIAGILKKNAKKQEG